MLDPNSAWGLKYFVNLFGNDAQSYVSNLISKNKPNKVILCMIYNPDEKVTGKK